VIWRRDLEAMNVEREAAGEDPFPNPRNAAAGSLRMLDPRAVAKRRLRLSLYQLVEGPKLHATQVETLTWMEKAGLPTHRRHVLCRTLDEVRAAIAELDRAREGYPFETDGVVLKVDAYRQQSILGETTKFPRWAIAYKFAPERARTVVRSIDTFVGRTGALTPVATLDPVQLAGTTVVRASLHNFDRVAAMDVRVGSTVDIEKAGEIIPQVMAVIERGDGPPTVAPTHCPSCGTPVVRAEGEVVLRCPNRRCPDVVISAVHHYTRRAQMDVDHLGPSLIEQLTKQGLVKDVADLYDLTVEQLVELERMAEKSASNVVAAIAQSKERTFERLLAALGVPQIGQVAARQLAGVVPSLDRMIELGAEGVGQAAETIHGFGPSMVDAVRAWMTDDDNLALLKKLQDRGVSRPFVTEKAATTGPLVGIRVCVTGVLSRKREEVHADVRAAGGEVHDAVKVGTTYLVAGAKTGQSKLDAARKRGTVVIDEETLNRMLRGEIAADAPKKEAEAQAAAAPPKPARVKKAKEKTKEKEKAKKDEDEA
jgi:DNA ligase (NAD+)